MKELSVKAKLEPSGGDFATSLVPSVPPAPPLFSTMNCWPSCSESSSASARAAMSVSAPGANGTTMRTVLVGQACAHAIWAVKAARRKIHLTTISRRSTKFRCISFRRQRRRRIVGQRQPGGIQHHRHHRVVAVQREEIERAVAAEALHDRLERGIAHLAGGMPFAAESVDIGPLALQPWLPAIPDCSDLPV